MNEQMSKQMRKMLIGVSILFGSIILYKLCVGFFVSFMISKNKSPAVTVSAMKAQYASWQPKVEATGSLRAIQGVNVTTSLAGMVQKIYFTPGAIVKKDDLLVQLNIDSDVAQLHSLQASAELAKITLKRDIAQYKIKAISKAVLDSDLANLKNFNAQVAEQQAVIAKKTITAPFSGRLGISAVDLGQYVNSGDKVVSLQQLDPLYIDFFIPQTELVKLKVGQAVRVTSDSYPNEKFKGKISTIDPIVDVNTRNVEIEAIIENPTLKLLPGMFGWATVDVDKPKQYITLPQSAVSFNPYGDIIYKLKEVKNDKTNKMILTANQTFVTTGEIRGDQIAILKGLNADEMVVTSGQLKLKNGSQVEIDNSVVPADNPAPKPVDE